MADTLLAMASSLLAMASNLGSDGRHPSSDGLQQNRPGGTCANCAHGRMAMRGMAVLD